ncbi:hypothetical protein P5Y53_08770 [Dyella jiangningensis]|uniref:hypothetical protein n=1 Tax=Dyella jiangningensis TaxID=1379159 RepID=UPI00240EE845|nr:hypothetical protein [Dyella jiangningensis]MDG2537750.1 hypothetical protein [Dyella jiangningensis]
MYVQQQGALVRTAFKRWFRQSLEGLRQFVLGAANENSGCVRQKMSLIPFASEKLIPSLVDTSAPLEQQAYQSWDLRNTFRSSARDGMQDQDLANRLDLTKPNPTWVQTVQKYSVDYSGDALWQQIINASQRSNDGVNGSLGIDPSKATGNDVIYKAPARFPSPQTPACTGQQRQGC